MHALSLKVDKLSNLVKKSLGGKGRGRRLIRSLGMEGGDEDQENKEVDEIDEIAEDDNSKP